MGCNLTIIGLIQNFILESDMYYLFKTWQIYFNIGVVQENMKYVMVCACRQ